MVTLREIRRQLHSIQNIEKITQAMEMVAASRLRKAQAKAEMTRPYFLRLKKILHQLIRMTRDFNHPLINTREVKKVALVVIAGDRGLCGAYNQNVFTRAEKFLKNYREDQVDLILFGRKTIDYFSGKKWKINDKFADWGGKITYHQVEQFTHHLINQYFAHLFDEVWVIYTHYINIAARKIMVEKILNIDIEHEDADHEKESGPSDYIFEPSVQEIFTEILPRYFITKVQSALNEAYASELGARIFAMRAATKNAEEMIEKLTLTRNKLRQTNITRELLEITACVESLK